VTITIKIDKRAAPIAFSAVVLVIGALWLVGIYRTRSALAARVSTARSQYATVSTDADSLRSAIQTAADASDPAQVSVALDQAKSLVKQFPEDAQQLGEAICPKATAPVDAGLSGNCSGNTDDMARQIGSRFEAYSRSASTYDFQALDAVSQLLSGHKAAARLVLSGPIATAYAQQRADGAAMMHALDALAH